MAPTRSTILENFKNGRQPEEYNLTIKSQENRVDFENCKDDEGKLRICTNIVQETNVVVEKIQEKREEDSKVLEYGEPEDTTIQGRVFQQCQGLSRKYNCVHAIWFIRNVVNICTVKFLDFLSSCFLFLVMNFG